MNADTPLHILRPDNTVDGPYTLSQTRHLWQSGSITLNHQIALEGGDWKSAASYRNLLETSENDQMEKTKAEVSAAHEAKKATGRLKAWVFENIVRHHRPDGLADTSVWDAAFIRGLNQAFSEAGKQPAP